MIGPLAKRNEVNVVRSSMLGGEQRASAEESVDEVSVKLKPDAPF